MQKAIPYGSKEYQTMIERMHHLAKKPFKIEEFCAQVAWMGKGCPVYPDGNNEMAEGPCKFLTSEEFDGYRCPVVVSLENFVPIIVRRGTDKQRRALEFLADMYLKYSQRRDLFPHDEESPLGLLYRIDVLLRDAEEIYRQLGLKKKARACTEMWKAMVDELSPSINHSLRIGETAVQS